MDVVMRELEAWKELSASAIKAHTDSETNMINEFSLMHAVKDKFPLHYMWLSRVKYAHQLSDQNWRYSALKYVGFNPADHTPAGLSARGGG